MLGTHKLLQKQWCFKFNISWLHSIFITSLTPDKLNSNNKHCQMIKIQIIYTWPNMFQTLVKVTVRDMLKWLQTCFLIGDIPQQVRTVYENRELPSMSWRALCWLLLKTTRCIQRPSQYNFLQSQYSWLIEHDTFGMTLGMQLTWPAHIIQVGGGNEEEEKNGSSRDGLQTTSLKWEASWQSDMQHCFISSWYILWWWITHVLSGGPMPAVLSVSHNCYNPSSSALKLCYVSNMQIHMDLQVSFVFPNSTRTITGYLKPR